MVTMNPKLGVFLHDALDSLEHYSTVFEFYHSFQALQDLLATVQPWLPESYFATRFAYGLQPEYQLFVLRFRPVTVLAAYRLATIYEECIGTDFQMQQRELGPKHPDLRQQSPMIAEWWKFLHDALDRIEHQSSVEAFFHSFESVRMLVLEAQPWLTEEYFTSRFVYGLKEDYQKFILRFHPTTIREAYKLALIWEESIYLHYFPEIECEKVELYAESSAQELLVAVSDVDRDNEMIVVGDSPQVVVTHQINGVSPPTALPQDYSICENVHMGFPGDGDKSVLKSLSLQYTYNNAMAMLILKEPKGHSTDVTTILVVSKLSVRSVTKGCILLSHSIPAVDKFRCLYNNMGAITLGPYIGTLLAIIQKFNMCFDPGIIWQVVSNLFPVDSAIHRRGLNILWLFSVKMFMMHSCDHLNICAMPKLLNDVSCSPWKMSCSNLLPPHSKTRNVLLVLLLGPRIFLIRGRVKQKGWLWLKLCHSPCIDTNAAPAQSFQIFNNMEMVWWHWIFFTCHWEPGPLAFLWQSSSMGSFFHKTISHPTRGTTPSNKKQVQKMDEGNLRLLYYYATTGLIQHIFIVETEPGSSYLQWPFDKIWEHFGIVDTQSFNLMKQQCLHNSLPEATSVTISKAIQEESTIRCNTFFCYLFVHMACRTEQSRIIGFEVTCVIAVYRVQWVVLSGLQSRIIRFELARVAAVYRVQWLGTTRADWVVLRIFLNLSIAITDKHTARIFPHCYRTELHSFLAIDAHSFVRKSSQNKTFSLNFILIDGSLHWDMSGQIIWEIDGIARHVKYGVRILSTSINKVTSSVGAAIPTTPLKEEPPMSKKMQEANLLQATTTIKLCWGNFDYFCEVSLHRVFVETLHEIPNVKSYSAAVMQIIIWESTPCSYTAPTLSVKKPTALTAVPVHDPQSANNSDSGQQPLSVQAAAATPTVPELTALTTVPVLVTQSPSSFDTEVRPEVTNHKKLQDTKQQNLSICPLLPHSTVTVPTASTQSTCPTVSTTRPAKASTEAAMFHGGSNTPVQWLRCSNVIQFSRCTWECFQQLVQLQKSVYYPTTGSARPHNLSCILCYDPGIEELCVVCWRCCSPTELCAGNFGRVLVSEPISNCSKEHISTSCSATH